MNEITTFNFDSFPVRIVKDEKGEPWFVAKDVAEILEYSETNRMTARLDEDEFISTKLVGMNMNSTLINESGLYNAIIGSSKPEAKRFKKWITSEVLPSIRKNGAYLTDTVIEDVLNDPDTIIRLAMDLKKEREAKKAAELEAARQRAITEEQENQLRIQAPDVEYTKAVLSAENLHTANSIAVHLGISAIRLNKFLVAAGW